MGTQAWRAAVVIAGAGLLEALRKRLMMVSALFCLVLLGLSVAAASVSVGEQARLIVDVGLVAASALGSVMAVALTLVSFCGDLSQRTAFTLLVRPMPRWAFVLGKFLGLVAAMMLVVSAMTLATAAVVRLYGDAVPRALWPNLWLNCVEMAVVVALTLLFATMAVPALAATYTLSLVLAGKLSGEIAALASSYEARLPWASRVLHGVHYAIPDLQKLALRAQAANNMVVPSGYVADATLYGFCYAACALVVAMWIFSRRRAV